MRSYWSYTNFWVSLLKVLRCKIRASSGVWRGISQDQFGDLWVCNISRLSVFIPHQSLHFHFLYFLGVAGQIRRSLLITLLFLLVGVLIMLSFTMYYFKKHKVTKDKAKIARQFVCHWSLIDSECQSDIIRCRTKVVYTRRPEIHWLLGSPLPSIRAG